MNILAATFLVCFLVACLLYFSLRSSWNNVFLAVIFRFIGSLGMNASFNL